MPIDNMILNPMLDPFRTMMKEIEDKGIEGEYADAMKTALSRMEALGQEMSDINDFNGALMQENLFGTFSDHYGKCLSAAASSATNESSGGYDDSALLKQILDGLKSSIRSIKESKQQSIDTDSGSETLRMEIEGLLHSEELQKGIQNLIDLGEQEGMTTPRFLRLQIEKGLDKAAEGMSVQKKGYEYEVFMAKADPVSPYHVRKAENRLNCYNELAASSSIGIPDSLKLSLATDKSDREIEPDMIRFDRIKRHWERIINTLDGWMRANSTMAMYIDPFKTMGSEAVKKKAIAMDKDCLPGELMVLMDMMNRYWSMSFEDIFEHETFLHEVNWDHIDESEEYIEFLRNKIYPICRPGQLPTNDLIAEWDEMFKGGRMNNPETWRPQERLQNTMDDYFGEGYYAKKFGPIVKGESNAQPWNKTAGVLS